MELTESQLTEFREVFDLVDRDKGGSIDVGEVRLDPAAASSTYVGLG